MAFPIIILSISLFMFWVIKSHKNKLSIIQNYHNIITESTANGFTSFSVLMIMLVIVLLGIIGFMGIKVDRFK